MSLRTLGRFTAPELGVLAEALSIAGWPMPLQVRVTAHTQDEVRAVRIAAEQALLAGRVIRDGRVAADLEEALITLARPTTAVDVTGLCGPDPGDLVRILVGYRGGAAVLAHQLPGPTEDVGGVVVVQTTAWGAVATELAAVLLALLPPVPPGRRPAITLRSDELAADQVVAREARRGRVERQRDELALLADGPFGTVGQVGVRTRTPDGHGGRRTSLRWLDVLGDGRYLYDTLDGAALTPCDPATLTRALATQLAREPAPDGAAAPAR